MSGTWEVYSKIKTEEGSMDQTKSFRKLENAFQYAKELSKHKDVVNKTVEVIHYKSGEIWGRFEKGKEIPTQND